MKEAPVENRFKARLESFGCQVVKLVTQGTAGAMDRMVLRPRWSPGPPFLVELKRPGKSERLLQQHRRDDWRKRGLQVLDVCDSYERVDEIYDEILTICNRERIDGL